MKGVVLYDGWEKTATDALLRWLYRDMLWGKAFAWFKPTCPGNVMRCLEPSVN